MDIKALSKPAPSFLPATCVLEMTYACSHKCLFCSCPWESNPSMKKKEMNLSQWKDCIKLMTEKGICNIAFTGGEALLRKDIFEIIEFAASCESEHIETKDGVLVSEYRPPKLYLISNGELVTKHVLALCNKHKVHLSMSLPGLRTFKTHTGKDSHRKILDNFRLAKDMDVTTTVNITVTKKNIFELYETIAEALLAGADTLLLNRFLPGGRGLKYAKELLLSKEEINEMLDIAEEVLRRANRSGHVGTELPKCIINDHDKYEKLKVSTKCSAAVNFFVIGPSGFIRTCNHSPVELCHYSDFETLRSNPYWKRFTQKDYYPSACIECTMISACDGGCREAAHVYCGEVDSHDPIFEKKY